MISAPTQDHGLPSQYTFLDDECNNAISLTISQLRYTRQILNYAHSQQGTRGTKQEGEIQNVTQQQQQHEAKAGTTWKHTLTHAIHLFCCCVLCVSAAAVCRSASAVCVCVCDKKKRTEAVQQQWACFCVFLLLLLLFLMLRSCLLV